MDGGGCFTSSIPGARDAQGDVDEQKQTHMEDSRPWTPRLPLLLLLLPTC